MSLSPELKLMIALFVVCLVVWIGLIVYKSKLEREEEDVFRTTPERLNDEQKAVLQKVDRLSKPMWIFGILTILLMVGSVALWLYHGLFG
jgi:Ca2+/Na+ antiporter